MLLCQIVTYIGLLNCKGKGGGKEGKEEDRSKECYAKRLCRYLNTSVI